MRNIEQFGERDRYQESEAGQHEEGMVAKAIEGHTAKVPSDVFLWIAGGAVAGSLALKAFGKNETANFVGMWVPTVLILGVYNKMVKLLGHDRRFSSPS
jgi:hypothetical protein